jgi:hypothetical protein
MLWTSKRPTKYRAVTRSNRQPTTIRRKTQRIEIATAQPIRSKLLRSGNTFLLPLWTGYSEE